MDDFATAMKIVGFVTAVVGTCAAVPAATWRLFHSTRAQALAVGARLRRRPKPQVVHINAATIGVTASVTATANVSANPPPTSIEERLSALETRASGTENRLGTVVADISREVGERQAAVKDLNNRLGGRIAELDQSIQDQQETTEQVDARALPVVLFGALLSTFPDGLTRLPAVGVVLFCIGFAWLVRGCYLIATAKVNR